MTYKSRTRGNAVLLDSEVLEASKNATGLDPMVSIREKYPDAELIFSTPDRFSFDAHKQLEDFKRGFHDEMTYFEPTPRAYQLPIAVGHHAHVNTPFFFEGELDRINALNATGRFSPRLYQHQEEALRHIQAMPYVVMELDSCKPFDLDVKSFDIESRSLQNFRPLITNPRRGVLNLLNSYSKMREQIIVDEVPAWDRSHVRDALAWGLDIRYKFKREDGKTHAQICKEELRTIKKRRKAAMKQLDACGARYEAALKEEENVR